MDQFLKELNEAQYEAVVNTEGPALVIAGAGSGKTRVLTYRVAYLLNKGIHPGNIICLTFTNKAAREMKERIALLVGEEHARHVWMGTFHSIFARILRYESDALGYPSSYTIYDTLDSKSLLKSIIGDKKLNDQIYKPGDVMGRISWAKNNLITPQAYLGNAQITSFDNVTKRPELGEIYKTYCIRCKRSGAMDFDDLLLNTNILFRDFPEILKKYQERFHYLLVDEYQDTNYSQYLIVNKLAALGQNICVVGDDAQSIYSFRGARIENILNFRTDYPAHRLFKLEQNYRSTQTIVNAANSLIAKNSGQIEKTVWSDKETGSRIKVIQHLTDLEEGFYVSNSILDTALSEQRPYSDYAILYRTNAQSRIFEEALRKRNIPYKVYGGISFYQRKEIKDMLAYLRLSVNHSDDEALRRIINYPSRGIGGVTFDKLESFAEQSGISIWEAIENADTYAIDLNRGMKLKLQGFLAMMNGFSGLVNELDAFEAARQIAAGSGVMKDLYNGNTPEERSRYENLEELINGIKEFVESATDENRNPSLVDYLENISLITDLDADKSEDRNHVTIMTMHMAKGLEFGRVYIAGVEEDLFPARQALESAEDLEEERRLFYVAVTRAKSAVCISYCLNRYRWGTPVQCRPSRFIQDIDPEYLEMSDEEPGNGYADRNRHNKWGEGEFGQGFSGGHAPNGNEYADEYLTGSRTGRRIPGGGGDAGRRSTGSRAGGSARGGSSNAGNRYAGGGGAGRYGIHGNAGNNTGKAYAAEMLSRKKQLIRKKAMEGERAGKDFIPDDPDGIRTGMAVEHNLFGKGKVLHIEGSPPNRKARVYFQETGEEKQLLLKFARLKILNDE